MDRGEYIQKRRRKYLAQVMDYFDEHIAPLIPEGSEVTVEEFRGMCRAKFNALAVDATDVMALDGYVNSFAEEVKDGLYADGRSATARS